MTREGGLRTSGEIELAAREFELARVSSRQSSSMLERVSSIESSGELADDILHWHPATVLAETQMKVRKTLMIRCLVLRTVQSLQS